MKYKLLSQWKEDESETDEEGYYSINLKLSVGSVDPFFEDAKITKTVVVTSHNSDNGFKVDEDRKKAVKDYCELNEIQYD